MLRVHLNVHVARSFRCLKKAQLGRIDAPTESGYKLLPCFCYDNVSNTSEERQ